MNPCDLELANFFDPREICLRCHHYAEEHPYWKRRPKTGDQDSSLRATKSDVYTVTNFLYDNETLFPEDVLKSLRAVLTTVYTDLHMDVHIGVIAHRWDLCDVPIDGLVDTLEALGLVCCGARVFHITNQDMDKPMTDRQRCDLAQALGTEWYVSQLCNVTSPEHDDY